MTAIRSFKDANEVKESHWRAEIAFGVAYDILLKQFEMEEGAAHDLLFPPIGEGPMDFDIEPPVPPMKGYKDVKWEDRVSKMIKEEE